MQTSMLSQILAFLTGRRREEASVAAALAEINESLKKIQSHINGSESVPPTLPEVVIEPEKEPQLRKCARVGFKGFSSKVFRSK